MSINPGNSAYDMAIDDEEKPQTAAERLKAEGAKPYVPGGDPSRFAGIKSGKEDTPHTSRWGSAEKTRGDFDRNLGRSIGKVYSSKVPKYQTEEEVTSAIANRTLQGNALEHYQNAKNYQNYLKSTQQPFYKPGTGKKPESKPVHIPGYAQKRPEEEEE